LVFDIAALRYNATLVMQPAPIKGGSLYRIAHSTFMAMLPRLASEAAAGKGQ